MPGVNRARGSTQKKLGIGAAKAKVLELIRDGLKVADAMAGVDRSAATYEDWLKTDPEFRASIAAVREAAAAARKRGKGEGQVEVPGFPEFCEKYLGMPLPLHHERVWDVLNGREPRDLHPAIRWQKGRDNRVLLNFPPFHAKTQVWSVQYALWRMLKDPSVRIAIVSKTQSLAKKIVFQILQYLERPQYQLLHEHFMPDGGWKSSSMPWTSLEIYLSNSGESTEGGVNKDPTLQALGYGSQIYGSRLDVIILDDLIDLKNAHQSEAIVDWIGREAASRIDTDGQLHVLGTRLAPNDIYQRLRDLVDWNGADPVWTAFAQPAVLERHGEHPDTWETLWPALADGRPMWDGVALAKAKAELNSEGAWQLTYQQTDAAINQTFPSGAVMASVDGRRAAGPLEHLYVVIGCDPAADGFTAIIVNGVDRATGRRFVLDGWNQARMPPDQLISKLQEFIAKYRASQLIVETNAFQGFLARTESLRAFAYNHGCVITEHRTAGHKALQSGNAGHTVGKWDEDMGVQSMAPLFLSCARHDVEADTWETTPTEQHLISLPNPKFSVFVDDLISQLTQWVPKASKKGVKTDLVMALWFTHVAIQKVLDLQHNVATHAHNPFLTRADAAKRGVVNLNELREAKLRGEDRNVYSAYGGLN